jgi:hypothetical protein
MPWHRHPRCCRRHHGSKQASWQCHSIVVCAATAAAAAAATIVLARVIEQANDAKASLSALPLPPLLPSRV